MDTCTVDDCDKPARSRGWCSVHYMRWRRHGSPFVVKRDPAEPAQCGSYGGYQAHTSKKETPCEPCREANREYMRAYRAANPQSRARERLRTNARSRALWRLAEKYADEFQDLYLQELGPAKRMEAS